MHRHRKQSQIESLVCSGVYSNLLVCTRADLRTPIIPLQFKLRQWRNQHARISLQDSAIRHFASSLAAGILCPARRRSTSDGSQPVASCCKFAPESFGNAGACCSLTAASMQPFQPSAHSACRFCVLLASHSAPISCVETHEAGFTTGPS